MFSHSFNHLFILPTKTRGNLYVLGMGESVVNSMTHSALENRRNKTGDLSSQSQRFLVLIRHGALDSRSSVTDTKIICTIVSTNS